MKRFFEEHTLGGNECLPEDRISKIKCFVMTRIEEDILMKKRRLFKSLVIAVSATVAIGATAVGAVAAAQPQIIEIDGIHYEVYQQDEFATIGKQVDGYDVEEAPDDSDFVLVSTDEYVDGDYRFVMSLYEADTNGVEALAGTQDTWWMGWYDVYYLPETGTSPKLAQMYIKGHFTWDEDQNYVTVDSRTVEYHKENYINQKYPIITECDPPIICSSNQGGLWGGNKYAQIEYRVDFEKALGLTHRYKMRLIVNVKGEAEVKCSIS